MAKSESVVDKAVKPDVQAADEAVQLSAAVPEVSGELSGQAEPTLDAGRPVTVAGPKDELPVDKATPQQTDRPRDDVPVDSAKPELAEKPKDEIPVDQTDSKTPQQAEVPKQKLPTDQTESAAPHQAETPKEKPAVDQMERPKDVVEPSAELRSPSGFGDLRVMEVSSERVTLCWDAVMSDGGAAVTSYIIVMRESDKNKYKKIAQVRELDSLRVCLIVCQESGT